mgnify:CR=1 FL=1
MDPQGRAVARGVEADECYVLGDPEADRPDLAIVSANLPEGALALCERLRRDLNVGSVIISRHPLANGPALDAAFASGKPACVNVKIAGSDFRKGAISV